MSRRVRMRCPVILKMGPDEATAVCVDLSAGGCAVELQGGLPVGATVELSIDLPGIGTLRAPAEVVRSREGLVLRELGLRLMTLDQTSLDRLHLYLTGSSAPVDSPTRA
jgi:hypothetical protein